MKIPNLNTISTLIDRLCIENVKKAHFQYLIEQNEGDSLSLRQSIVHQEKMIEAIQHELVTALDEVFKMGKYEYLGETRTFKQNTKVDE